MDSNDTKNLVREKYADIAEGKSCCCGKRTAASTYSEVGESYKAVDGYFEEADLGLGCGVPTEHAQLQPGQTVLDLGSGAGNDVFVARREVGPEGYVIGVDFTAEMIALAESNRAKLGYDNVEFRRGEIEDLPVCDNKVDVVLSNCVLNLVPDKQQTFREIFRVLKPGGHFSVSDIVLEGELPAKMRSAAEFYVGCIAGALQKTDYLSAIEEAGFTDIRIVKERQVVIPDSDLAEHLCAEEISAYHASGSRVLSITVKGAKG